MAFLVTLPYVLAQAVLRNGGPSATVNTRRQPLIARPSDTRGSYLGRASCNSRLVGVAKPVTGGAVLRQSDMRRRMCIVNFKGACRAHLVSKDAR